MTRRLRYGFTLMEVIIAVGITAMLGSLLAFSFHATAKTREETSQMAERYRQVRGAMTRLCRELSAAYVSDRYDKTRYRDAYDRPTNFVGQRERLMFSTLANQRLHADAKMSDQMLVEYQVKSAMERGVRDRKDLFRRVKTVFEDSLERGGTEDVIFEGISSIQFAYWDSEKKDWVDEWDTRRAERQSKLPTRVRVTLTAPDEDGKPARYTTQARIVLNTAFEAYE